MTPLAGRANPGIGVAYMEIAKMITAKVNLTPIDAMDQRGAATTLEGAGELAMLRHHVVETMRVLQPLIKRSRAATGNPNYSSEAGRAAAVALTKLEEALIGQNVGRTCVSVGRQGVT